MEEFQYRRMLNDISQNIREEQLDSLKFMCRAFVPVRRLEAIQSPLEVWVALEEKEKLGPKDTVLLKELLKDREDLIRLVENYEQCLTQQQIGGNEPGSNGVQHANSNVRCELGEEFDFLSENLGKDWRKLARKMTLNEPEIAAIEEKHPRNLQEQIRDTLTSWATKHNNHVTREDLVNALKSCQFNMLVHQLEKLGLS